MTLERHFSALAAPQPAAGDAEAARRIWLRARLDAIAEGDNRRIRRLRFGGVVMTVAALDAIAPIVALACGAPLLAALAAMVVTHGASSLALLR